MYDYVTEVRVWGEMGHRGWVGGGRMACVCMGGGGDYLVKQASSVRSGQ